MVNLIEDWKIFKSCPELLNVGLIPYGELNWLLVLVEAWLEQAGIEDGPLFRGYYKGFKTQRPAG